MIDRIARSAATPAWLVFIALACIAALGCASTFSDPTGRWTSLEQAQRRYTQLVRWGEIKRASAFVEPELREEFLSYAPYFDQIRITDVDAEEVNLDTEDSAAVDVTYHAYSFASFEEKRILETQEWTRSDGVQNTWLVRPQLGEIVAAFYADAN
jgi:hypothetical protein